MCARTKRGEDHCSAFAPENDRPSSATMTLDSQTAARFLAVVVRRQRRRARLHTYDERFQSVRERTDGSVRHPWGASKMLINFCRSWQVLEKSKSPGSRVPQVVPRVKRPYLQAQSALELVAVGGPLLRKNWSKPHLSEEIDPHFISEFCDFPNKLCEFYLGMLQSFPPWKSALNVQLTSGFRLCVPLAWISTQHSGPNKC